MGSNPGLFPVTEDCRLDCEDGSQFLAPLERVG